MNMLHYTRDALEKVGALTPAINSHVQQVVNAIPFPTVPERMKVVVAVTQLIAFASQFRRNICLWDDTIVPINTISFILTGSGAGKDSSVKAARKCFKIGYQRVEEHRVSVATTLAIAEAISAGEDPATASHQNIYRKYMMPIPPIDIRVTTGPGLIQHVNDIGDLPISSGLIFTG